MPVRDIDHVVIAVHDLARAARDWEALGFTTTPRAVHPFGTANRLIQLDGNFIEFVEIDDPTRIRETTDSFFGFAAHNRDFLADRGEGMSMLVLTSADRDADQRSWSDAGLKTYEPFDFERMARQPDGSDKRVAFRLAFTSAPALAGLGFFVCQQETPETFWKPEYQRHANGARRIRAVGLESPDPAGASAFLERFSDGAATADGVALGRDRIDLAAGGPAAMPVLEIAVADLDAASRAAPDARAEADALVVAPTLGHGVTIRMVAG